MLLCDCFISNTDVYLYSGPGDHGNAEDYGDPMAVLDLTGLDSDVPNSDGLEQEVLEEVAEEVGKVVGEEELGEDE